MPNFSEVEAPLTDLMKKDGPNHIKDWLSHHEKVSHHFTILSSVVSTSISCTGSLGRHKSRPFFSGKKANVTHLRSNLRTCMVRYILWDRSCSYRAAVRVDLEDYFGQKWLQTLSGLHKNQNCMLVDLSRINSVLTALTT